MRSDRPGDSGLCGARGGFSLIEALVVLAITAMTLSLLFSMTGRGVESGFRIGRRALDQADRTLAVETLRTLLQSPRIQPLGILPNPERMAMGDQRSFSAIMVLTRPTPCGGRGVSERLRITLEGDDARTQVLCARGGEAPRLVLDQPGRLEFSYSPDGVNWSSELADEADGADLDEDARIRERRLFVRLADHGGSFEIVARSSSGRPELARLDLEEEL